MHARLGTRDRLYIAGGPGGSSIGPKVHEYIAKPLGLPWTCEFLQLASVDEVMRYFRAPDFAGGIVTMPHKRTIIPQLDHCDHLVKILGACNFVYLAENGQLCGTNTDWVGIYDSILPHSPGHAPGMTGMVYGAGGASRAAIYALWAKLTCDKIYVVNRDSQEVTDLFDDIQRQGDLYRPELVHVRSVAESKALPAPYFIVSTIPDFDAVTPDEVQARDILVEFLSRSSSPRGILLDMCYHPPIMRNLRLAIQHGYRVIQGYTVVASQFSCQWKFWTGEAIEMETVFEMTERLVQEEEAAAVARATIK
ncbi:hypothetical protein BDV32DRAFT_145387 [Aspergillus pseudonomiae]|nr:hypothetical protein BDV32DRAFT_145387 [Aspergillus pseudonomiae]